MCRHHPSVQAQPSGLRPTEATDLVRGKAGMEKWKRFEWEPIRIGFTFPETNSSHLKMNPWKFGDSYWKASSLMAMLVLGRVPAFTININQIVGKHTIITVHWLHWSYGIETNLSNIQNAWLPWHWYTMRQAWWQNDDKLILGHLFKILILNVSAILGRIPLLLTTFFGVDQPAGKVAINCLESMWLVKFICIYHQKPQHSKPYTPED